MTETKQIEWKRDWTYVCDKCGRREIEKAVTRTKLGYQTIVLRCKHCGYTKRKRVPSISKTFSAGQGKRPFQISKERTL